MTVDLRVVEVEVDRNRPSGVRCGPQCCAANEVRPQLDELLVSSVEGVSLESVEVTDTVVRVEARTTVRQAACPGCGY
ncbi:hypothetical protein [Streptomyces phaeochromogenes]